MATYNTAPDIRPSRWAGFEVNDQLVGQDYSLAPGHVGSYDENGNFIPSKYDFTGFAPSNRDLVLGANPSDYEGTGYALSKPNGETILYNPYNDTVTKYAPAYSAYTNVGQNQWGAFAAPNVGNTYDFQGTSIPVDTNAYRYNPATKSLYLSGGEEGLSPAGGNPSIARMAMDSGGGFSDWLTENGWVAPLALAGGAAAAEFLPALAGEAGAGATELAGPTYGELGVTGVEGGMAGPTYGELGYTGLNNAQAIAAADAASQSSQLASALKTANQVRQGLSTTNSLAKLLTQGAGSGLTSSLGKLAQGANPQGQALTGVVRGNQNPFTYAPQQPIQDTRQAQLASLLKQG